jgi:Primase C terminal 2 (PriCT-2)/RepB DNA-primase from phage plasmid
MGKVTRKAKANAGFSLTPLQGQRFHIDPHDAKTFLKLLDPIAGAFCFSWYPEKGTSTPLNNQLTGLDATYRTAPFDEELAYLLGVLNGHQRAIYVCMNVLGARNTRTDDNVAKVRAIFADFDNGLPDRPFPIKPTCIVHTSNDQGTKKGRYQAFWRVEGVSLQEFNVIEARLVAEWGADPNSVNLSRIQRLPGYWHQKHGVPHLVRIVEENDVTYMRKQILKAFPPIAREARQQNGKENRLSTSTKLRLTPKCKDKRGRASRTFDEDVNVDALRSALAHLAATPHPSSKHAATYSDDYDTWVRFGLAIKRGLGDDGFALWDEWARMSNRYPGEAESRAKWDRSFDTDARSGDRAVTVGTIYHCAKRHGWCFTRHMVASSLAKAMQIFRTQRGQQ